MIKAIEKGYTVTVTSWENDGDNSRTKSKTVETIEEAEKLHKICVELFKSENSEGCGVGNSMDHEGDQTLIDYVEENPELFPDLVDSDEELIIEYFENLGWELMGGSEDYDFRVCESVSVVYSPEDIYLEEIIF